MRLTYAQLEALYYWAAVTTTGDNDALEIVNTVPVGPLAARYPQHPSDHIVLDAAGDRIHEKAV